MAGQPEGAPRRKDAHRNRRRLLAAARDLEFEFDPLKSASNREKHGVDFVRAQELWQDPMRIEVPARTTGEPRWLVVGRMGDKHWSAVVTYREDRIRIISVRRARDEEIRIYEV
jgi:hypothetical protein